MKLKTSLVAVRKVTSGMARSSFDTDEIEKAAHLILGVEGTINPIILRRTSLESYEVVEGHFEYYAAVRAREISLSKGEMIQAIILEPENEETLLKQIDLLRKRHNQKPELSHSDHSSHNDFESRFFNLEKMFKFQFEELRKENRELRNSLTKLEDMLQNPRLTEESLGGIVSRLEAIYQSISVSRKNTDELKQNPLNLNLASENELIDVPGIGEKIASRIVERRKAKGLFNSIDELSEIEKISRNTIDKYEWRKFFVVNDPSIET
ncbi:MAG: helix-hairpin-helix domain-containing protein [Leptolyngbyaceae cyanobacterium]